jgi:hypothetical protein
MFQAKQHPINRCESPGAEARPATTNKPGKPGWQFESASASLIVLAGRDKHYCATASAPGGNAKQRCLPYILLTMVILARLLTGAQTGYASGVLFVSPAGQADGVCGSWESACSLAYALQTAAPGSEIWVAAGTYLPGDARGSTFRLRDDIALYGGFSGSETQRELRDPAKHPAILSGDIGVKSSAADNIYHVASAESVGATAILDGFTIQGGLADDPASPNDRGAGLFLVNASPTLRNLLVTDNKAQYGGGLYGSGSSYRLESSTFLRNQAGYGAGIYQNGASAPALVHVAFYGNTATVSGGAFYNIDSAAPDISNALFVGNRAPSAGAIYNKNYGHPTLRNVTIYGNPGGAFYSSNPYGTQPADPPYLVNVIAWNNLPKAFWLSNSKPAIRYSILEVSCPPAANCKQVFSTQPYLARLPSAGADGQWGTLDDDYGDLRYLSGSLGIDMGDNTAVLPEVTADFAGSPRFIDDSVAQNYGLGVPPIVDIGAYEAMLAPTATRILAISPETSVSGQAVTVQFAVDRNPANTLGEMTGRVTVSDGAVSCTALATAGQCSLVFPTAGTHAVTAAFAGDPLFHPSRSAAAAHLVNKAAVQVTLALNPSPSAPGEPVHATFTVNPLAPGAGMPGGTVSVSSGSHACTASVAQATCDLTFPGMGKYTVTAQYSGDANYQPATSTHVTQNIGLVATTTTILSTSPAEPVVGQPVIVYYQVSADQVAPDGQVTVTGGENQCQASATAGNCALTFSAAGAYDLAAGYSSSSDQSDSISETFGLAVDPACTSIALSVAPPVLGQTGRVFTVTFVLEVTLPGAGDPTGVVEISDGSQNWQFDAAQSENPLTITTGATGLTAHYVGDENFTPSTSQPAGLTTFHYLFLPTVLH